ncbi:uncharacterized protein LOC123429725 [Hordeum vulgare subsp. vulgare]|uniref:uncharacterized protein LOC123429725 n=1 Tax=Hordeum vulgare subsp. vulgare TaxID=112509 RepID=UPI001D1A51F5|nr:uncharacterized protein LOC123429725 [Hordeum vulgare subsp. vulgare]
MEGLDAQLAVSLLCLDAASLVFTHGFCFYQLTCEGAAFHKSKHLAKRIDQDMDGDWRKTIINRRQVVAWQRTRTCCKKIKGESSHSGEASRGGGAASQHPSSPPT